jgi:redox-sensitive bicupin YhaK (pirin superfamily)
MESDTMAGLYHAPPTDVTHDQGGFRTNFDFPGRNLPGHADHGYGPLATVVESFMDPDTLIPMHPHRDEEIVSWVPAGVMRHDDGEGNRLVTDPEHLMVMNAGRGFRHEERTLAGDPPLRMLQIFVRPHSLGLEPGIQHEPLPDPVAGEWRHLFGPEGSEAPLHVRNAVHLYDCRLGAGDRIPLPEREGFDAYVYVFEGSVEADGTRFERNETGLLVGGGTPTLRAREDSVVVCFLVDPDALVTRQGTIGR